MLNRSATSLDTSWLAVVQMKISTCFSGEIHSLPLSVIGILPVLTTSRQSCSDDPRVSLKWLRNSLGLYVANVVSKYPIIIFKFLRIKHEAAPKNWQVVIFLQYIVHYFSFSRIFAHKKHYHVLHDGLRKAAREWVEVNRHSIRSVASIGQCRSIIQWLVRVDPDRKFWHNGKYPQASRRPSSGFDNTAPNCGLYSHQESYTAP